MLNILSDILIGIGIIFIIFGVVGIYRFKNFYSRILVASKVDTVGVITVLLGVALRYGVSFFSAKIILVAVILLIITPLVTHIVTRSAYLSGYRTQDDKK